MSKSPDAFRSIGEVSSLVGVAPHVLRYWESQFTQLSPVKRGDGRRYYRPDDVRLVAGLCQVMREEGLSIRGARRLIAADRGAGLRQIGALRLGETLGEPLGLDRPAMRLALPESETADELLLDAPVAAAAPQVPEAPAPAPQAPSSPAPSSLDAATMPPRPAPEQLPLSWTMPPTQATPAGASAVPAAGAQDFGQDRPASHPPDAAPDTAPDTAPDPWLARLVLASAALRRHAAPLPAPLVRALRASARESR